MDVFFVISGFLITRHMLREVADRGTISLSGFWANRARRILPASLLVILVTVLVAALRYPIDEIARISSQALASTVYVQNWLLASESVDYLAADNVPTPFQHFWSLSVEEQFYFVWPILLVAIVWLALRRRRGEEPSLASDQRTRRWIQVAFSVVVIASFLYSVVQVSGGDATGYFSSIGRLWELGLGGVLAAFYRDPVARPRLRSAVSFLGYLMIALACWRINADTPFPGVAASLPVVGTALVIAAGRTSGLLSLTRIVELRPVQAIGDWSYSIYLWHFGLIVTATMIWEPAGLPLWLKGAIVALTLAISYLSYRFVEQPFRTKRWAAVPPRKVLLLAATGLLVTSLVCVALPLRIQAIQDDWNRRAASVRDEAARYQVDPNASGPLAAFPDGRVAITPNPLLVAADRSDEGTPVNPGAATGPHPCQAEATDTSTAECLAGVPSSPTRVVLVGDSHATVMLAPLARIATQRNWRLETYLHASCPFSLARRVVEATQTIKCAEANTEVVNKLLADPPALVISVSWANIEWDGAETDPDVGVRGYASLWQKLAGAGIPVVAFRDTPRPLRSGQACMSANYEHPEKCAAPVAKAYFQHDEVVKAAAQVRGTTVVNLDKMMCTSKACPTVINHILVYRDTNHITTTWAKALTSAIASQLPTDLHR